MNTEHFLPKPHCPSSAVTVCAVGEGNPEIYEALQKLKVEIFPIPDNSKLSIPVQSHADLQIGMLKGDCVAVGKGEEALRKRLESLGFQVCESSEELSANYPKEALLDFLSLGDMIIGNTEIIENEYLLKFSHTIHINQGYTKCNVAVINDHALITSDSVAAQRCKSAGLDVLQIHPGYIELSGYEYGFIGGCCGLIAPDRLAVCGELQTHPDYDKIQAFLQKHSVTAISLCKGKMKDIGGIIPLKQKE